MGAFEPSPETAMSDVHDLELMLAELMTGVRNAQAKVRDVLLANDEHIRQLQSKVVDLEAQNLSRDLDIRALERENASLRQTVEQKTPELAEVVRERDEVAMKLRNAHKVINDLITPRKTNGTQPDVTTKQEPTSRPLKPRRSRGAVVQVESDDESTVRLVHSNASATPANPISASCDGVNSAASSNPMASEGIVESISPATIASRQRFSTSGTGKAKQVPWYLEFKRRPATRLDVMYGAIPFDILQSKLILDDDVVEDVAGMEFMSGYDTQVLLHADIAFVYRAVILEGPEGTYLIGWGDEQMERNIQKRLKEPREVKVYFWPAMKHSGWFYIGIHALSFAPLPPVWSKLCKEDKEMLVDLLQERNPDMDVSEFKRGVRAGTLVQCCIQLEARGTKAESLEYLRDYGLLDGDIREQQG